MIAFFQAASLVFVLLNPFLVIVYLVDLVEKLDRRQFTLVLVRAGLIASAVFSLFAVVGDAVFADVLHAEFASFQIFGGIVFLLIGLQFVFRGPRAIEILRGESKHIAGAVAMPVLIGPGTISASVLLGKLHEPLFACGAVVTAVAFSVAVMLLLKLLHDLVKPRTEELIERYVEIAGRIFALVVGTISIDMIMKGLGSWLEKL